MRARQRHQGDPRRAAIRLIASRDEALGSFLSRAVRTGAYCSYEPIDEGPIVWGVEMPAPGATGPGRDVPRPARPSATGR